LIKDGTLVEDVPYNIDPGLIRLSEGAVDSLRSLQRNGYALIVITNQSGMARGFFTEQQFLNSVEALIANFENSGVKLDALYYCPHHPGGNIKTFAVKCDCRKPKPGLLLKAAQEFNIDMGASWMVGDILDDIEAGNLAGCRTILIDNGHETEWILNIHRFPTATVTSLGEIVPIVLNAHHPHEVIDRNI
jgi:D-glycero-D-manno-heptose 1,7-bisphosphate phosphatase